jgi:hypothetical protein
LASRLTKNSLKSTTPLLLQSKQLQKLSFKTLDL